MAKEMKYRHYLHGGDYNPEQWLDRPDILQKDIEYFKKAHINTVSVGIFSWAVLEPEEGKYNFDWLEEIINNLYKEGIYTILATPSGARPKWMADKYEEVLRMDPDRTRRFFGGRHNHCFTSPVYREKVHAIDKKLAERFGNHPAVMFKKSAVLAVGGFQHFPYFEDYYLWVRMLQNGAKAMNLAQPLLLMRAGQAMYSRRGGLKYLKCVYRFRKYLWKCKFSSFGDFFISVSAQTAVCLLPNRVRIFVYHKFLRR